MSIGADPTKGTGGCDAALSATQHQSPSVEATDLCKTVQDGLIPNDASKGHVEDQSRCDECPSAAVPVRPSDVEVMTAAIWHAKVADGAAVEAGGLAEVSAANVAEAVEVTDAVGAVQRSDSRAEISDKQAANQMVGAAAAADRHADAVAEGFVTTEVALVADAAVEIAADRLTVVDDFDDVAEVVSAAQTHLVGAAANVAASANHSEICSPNSPSTNFVDYAQQTIAKSWLSRRS